MTDDLSGPAVGQQHMVADPDTMIRRMAAFCGIPLSDALLALTKEHTSRAFMLKHKDRFDDAMMRERSEQLGGLPPGSDSAKVQKAGSGRRQDELPDFIRLEMEGIWRSDVTPHTGFETFGDLDRALRELAA